eukprot:3716428-Pleurochrysis_carterae.AAC.2
MSRSSFTLSRWAASKSLCSLCSAAGDIWKGVVLVLVAAEAGQEVVAWRSMKARPEGSAAAKAVA